jgi:hypothetical protein
MNVCYLTRHAGGSGGGGVVVVARRGDSLPNEEARWPNSECGSSWLLGQSRAPFPAVAQATCVGTRSSGIIDDNLRVILYGPGWRITQKYTHKEHKTLKRAIRGAYSTWCKAFWPSCRGPGQVIKCISPFDPLLPRADAHLWRHRWAPCVVSRNHHFQMQRMGI